MKDLILLLHPVIAVAFVFPLIGIVVQLALKVRQRRLQSDKSVAPQSGREHVLTGKMLTGAVVGITLLALANDIGNALLKQQNIWKITEIGLLFFGTIAALVLLYRAKNRLWRAVFAVFCGMGLVILGCQDGIYRNTEHWYISHYYYGMTAALLMIFALAILPDIYRNLSWRNIHICLNVAALLLFVGQSITGTRSLLEIPLHWQESYIQQLYEQKCEIQACTIQPPHQ